MDLDNLEEPVEFALPSPRSTIPAQIIRILINSGDSLLDYTFCSLKKEAESC
jgi:hypothetical protein